jgi:naringenin degradation protein FdeH
MTRSFRRLVTGHDAQGRSILVDDRRIEETGAVGNFNFWRTEDGADASADAPAKAFPFFPPQNGTTFRVFRIPPADPTMTPEGFAAIVEGFFAEVGDPSCRVDASRNPLMHRTPTIDYIMLLSGEASLVLDEGEPIPLRPLDAIVQRATNHTWVNTGREDAVFLAVMIGTQP